MLGGLGSHGSKDETDIRGTDRGKTTKKRDRRQGFLTPRISDAIRKPSRPTHCLVLSTNAPQRVHPDSRRMGDEDLTATTFAISVLGVAVPQPDARCNTVPGAGLVERAVLPSSWYRLRVPSTEFLTSFQNMDLMDSHQCLRIIGHADAKPLVPSDPWTN
ncbi:hypothetical protein GGTG_06766 [Gaeumannomyces tritici R3-111a-1]|uniref:Uncharacterized protein n=1 Tax=Gaeumannomyces tritici (strain R3-111a-1) TaxID=644352 RepID=J3NZR9_GAET3|nr:hypothetical protein GGTG_06766 [Gaeumannomyces tritici R3-111a-1]EJT76852.1 hypothetical protein GGTG_06766 [Gaeumannomyces tritici R3-111a-1]